MQYVLIHAGAPDLDEAWAAAARHPMARAGIVEVRPFRRLGKD